jgi:hypothetical protein
VVLLLRELAERVEALRGRAKWGGELEKALGELMRELVPRVGGGFVAWQLGSRGGVWITALYTGWRSGVF